MPFPPARPANPTDPPDPPDPPDVIALRVGRLEEDVREMRADLKGAVKDLSFLRGRVEHLPTTWVLITTVVGTVVGGGIALLGLMLRFLPSH